MKAVMVFCSLLLMFQVDGNILKMSDYEVENILDAKMCERKVGRNLNSVPLKLGDRAGILPEDNPSLNLYYLCLFERKSIIDQFGDINEGFLRTYLRKLFTNNQAITPAQKQLVDESIDNCKHVSGKDVGEKSVKLQNCILNKLYDDLKE
ncbi:hypothetical protein FQA39_LY18159 [Lamprigera yunnana]|nr:hypothetical protein FQA39_LY18159 [Lamprigera yunnana]